MTPIRILTHTREPGTCRSCKAAIVWATVADSGRRMPFNPPLVAKPMLIRADVSEVDMARTTSHFATCPQADRWRRR